MSTTLARPLVVLAQHFLGPIPIVKSSEKLSQFRDLEGNIMSADITSQRRYLTALQFLKKRYQETKDPKEKRRIGSLLDGEEDSEAMIEFIQKLKTEAAKELHSRAAQRYIVKHVLNLSAELKSIK